MNVKEVAEYVSRTPASNRDSAQLKRSFATWYRKLPWTAKMSDSHEAVSIALDRVHAFDASNKSEKNSPFGSEHATIRQGSTGSDVIAWQKVLGIPQTGTFDQNTLAATKQWQSAKGVIADGVVGPATWGTAPDTSSPGSKLFSGLVDSLSKLGSAAKVSGALLLGVGVAIFLTPEPEKKKKRS